MKFFSRPYCAIILLSFLLAACGDKTREEKTQQLPAVKVSYPIKRKITEWDEYTGRFRAVDRVEIRARVTGYLDQILFTDGQRVKEGDTLFVIDQRSFKISLAEADAAFMTAQKELKRAESLRKKRVISEEELDRKLQEFRIATAKREEAALKLAFTEVKAPFSGLMSRHFIDRGNLVSGEPTTATLLTTIVKTDPIHFYFEASEKELLKYIRLDRQGKREGSRTKANPIFVKLQDEAEFVHEGVVDFVNNELDPLTATMQARAIFENDDFVLQPGMFGRAKVPGSGEYEAVLIPDTVVSTNLSQRFVYVLNDANQVEVRPLTLGPLQDNLRIVREGLSVNDRIIVTGFQMLRPGMMVAPLMVDLLTHDAMPSSKE